MINIAEQLPDIVAKDGNGFHSDRCYVELAKTGSISIAKAVQFLFHCSWLKEDPLPSILAIREQASLVIKNNFKIYSGAEVYINKNATLILGSGYISNHVNLHCFESIEIGEDLAIADHVTIRDSDNHLFNNKPAKMMTQPITIGDHVWIGTGVIILKGVHIGNGAVIAAGAVVNKNIPRGCLAGGIPAKVLKKDITWQ